MRPEDSIALRKAGELCRAETVENAYHRLTLRHVAKLCEAMVSARSRADDAEALDELSLAESEYCEQVWNGQSARQSLMNLLDDETVRGNQEMAAHLQQAVDLVTGYVRGYLGMELDEEKAEDNARATYQTGEDGPGGMYAEAGVAISPSMRKKYATVVRHHPDGTKDYKFPIPDKAHARAALARINQSDLSSEEKTKVRRRAHAVLVVESPVPVPVPHPEPDADDAPGGTTGGTGGTTPPAAPAMGEAEGQTPPLEQGTILDMIEEAGEIYTLTEAKYDLATNELEVTFLQPAFNRSKARYYQKSAIKEAVESGKFNDLKMFMNHASPQELAQRPERSVNDWVSTMKEAWIDPSTGAGKAKVKVVQNWFGSFLKELQENDALREIGLSIFAQGLQKSAVVEGQKTAVVEKFHRVMSVDWVTEPGAGGRIDSIWESHENSYLKEQELIVLKNLSAVEALAELRETRNDVLELLAAETNRDAEMKESVDKATALETELATLKEANLEREKAHAQELADSKRIAQKATQTELLREALTGAASLPKVAQSRIQQLIDAELKLREDGELDAEGIKTAVAEAVKAEEEYLAAAVKESGAPTGIKGLGSSQSSTSGDENSRSRNVQVESSLAKRFGHPTEKVA